MRTTYTDAWAMSQPLPTGGFEWVDPPSIQTILDHPDKTDKGYILEVDLEYPSNLHHKHNAYPLAPARTSGGSQRMNVGLPTTHISGYILWGRIE